MQLDWEEGNDGTTYTAYYKGALIFRFMHPTLSLWMFSIERLGQAQMFDEVEDLEEAAMAIIDSLPPLG